MHKNYLQRVEEIKAFALQYYEPGRLDKCYSTVWRMYVYPKYFISYDRFMRIMHIDVEAEWEKLISRGR